MAIAPKKPVAKATPTPAVKPAAKPAAKVTKAPAMPTKRPAVGADKSAKKKYGSSSWNNGFTN